MAGEGLGALRRGVARRARMAFLCASILLSVLPLPQRPKVAEAAGMTWTTQTSGTTAVLYDVTYGGGQFVAVGGGGTILTSSNGAAWTAQSAGTTQVLNGVVHGGAGYVGVGHGSTIVTSPNGTAWTAQNISNIAYNNIFEDVAYGAGQYVAVGWNGTIVTSPTGATWTAQPTGTSATLYNVTYGGGQFVAVGQNGTILTSPTGTAWTPQMGPAGTNFYGVTYGGGKFVAVGSGGAVYVSQDGGVTWTAASSGTTQSLIDVTYDDKCQLFVAVGGGGTILSSPDGMNWTAETSGTNLGLLGAVHGAGPLVAVGDRGTILTATSPCGTAGSPDLAVSKTHTGPLVAGQPVTYQITVSNVGTAAMSGWIGVSDPLPSGTANVTYSAPAPWTCNLSGGVLMCTYNGGTGFALQPGQSLPPITVTFTVPAGATTVKNCARLYGGGNMSQDTNPDNNLSCDVADVQLPAGKCAPLPNGAVAWWPLNEQNAATAVTDIVGGHTGAPMSGPVGSTTPPGPNPVPGKVGGALYFYLQNTYVRVPDSPGLNFGTGDFTIDAWVNPVQVGPSWFQPIVDKAQAVAAKGGAQGYRLYVKNGKVLFVVADGSNTALVSAPIAYGMWQLVAAERAGNALNLYVNGALAATAPLPPGFGSVSNTADLLVGGITAVGLPGQPIIGEIGLDEVELFNRALTAQEVQSIYNAGPAGKCQPTGNPGKPDLAVSKKPTGLLVAGQQASYQIVVSNVGTAAANTIVVTDTLGPGLTYFSATGTGWNCAASGQTVTCTYGGSVPPGGSLPPITVTVQVAPDARKVENCAVVKIFEEPGVTIPDANPANDRACDVSPVGPGEGKPGAICGVKFNDRNGNGVQDAGEPGLAGWTIQLFDQSGNVVATSVTDRSGRYCFEKLKPGTYVVSEDMQPGWFQTFPSGAGIHTVTVGQGIPKDGLVADFGNVKTEDGCCVALSFPAGKADQFSTADGATAEPATPPPGKPQAFFDETAPNKVFWHRIVLPQGNCVRGAKLTIRAKPLQDPQTTNDRLYLYSGSGGWVANIGSASGNPGPSLLPNPWTPASYPGGQVFTLDLSSLPGGGNLLPALHTSRVLDVAVQDDTSIDDLQLAVTFCQCGRVVGGQVPLDVVDTAGPPPAGRGIEKKDIRRASD